MLTPSRARKLPGTYRLRTQDRQARLDGTPSVHLVDDVDTVVLCGRCRRPRGRSTSSARSRAGPPGERTARKTSSPPAPIEVDALALRDAVDDRPRTRPVDPGGSLTRVRVGHLHRMPVAVRRTFPALPAACSRRPRRRRRPRLPRTAASRRSRPTRRTRSAIRHDLLADPRLHGARSSSSSRRRSSSSSSGSAAADATARRRARRSTAPPARDRSRRSSRC